MDLMSKQTQDYYTLLGVSRTADTATIKKAFRELARTKHPDKGGNADEFKDLSRAASVLQDHELRAAYDKHGVDGVDQREQQQQRQQHHHQNGHGAFHFGPIWQQRPPQSKERVLVKVSATLEELLTGVDKSAAFSWQKPCSDCCRSGCKPGKSASRCRDCRGAGLIVQVRQLGPGIIQQQPLTCSSCNGQGTYISKSDRCSKCGGQRTKLTEEKLSIRVPQG